MAIEYLGLSAVNGPLVVLEGVQNAAYDEIVEMTVAGNTHKIGRIIEIYGDKAIIQVFEGCLLYTSAASLPQAAAFWFSCPEERRLIM